MREPDSLRAPASSSGGTTLPRPIRRRRLSGRMLKTAFTLAGVASSRAASSASHRQASALGTPPLLQIGVQEDAATAWTMLGDNWWLTFVDGWAHGLRMGTFDDTELSRRHGQQGHFIEPLQRQYAKFTNASELQQRWTLERALQLNIDLRETSCDHVSDPLCLGQFSLFTPRGRTDLVRDMPIDAGPLQNNTLGGRPINAAQKFTRADKRDLLSQAFAAYDDATNGTSIDADWQAPRRAMGAALPALARLFATLAEIHPFMDANGRTRNFVLQAEATRRGGHPLLLHDAGWHVYYCNDLAEVESMILTGWCAWKCAVETGRSPYYVAPGNGTSTSVVSAQASGDEGLPSARKQRAADLAATLYDETNDQCVACPSR